jgi:hypothetical protein
MNCLVSSQTSDEDIGKPVEGLLLHTDQTDCYDEQGRNMPCEDSGQDGAAQKRIWAAPRFLDQGDTVLDRLTGLIWTKDVSPTGFPLTWQEALSHIRVMNEGTSQEGLPDWRLPNRKELFSLISHRNINPALPAGHPFTNVFSGYYWTSTTCVRLPREAWYVHLGGGRVFKGMKHGSYMVWPVKGPKGGPLILPQSGQRDCFSETGEVINCSGTGQDGEFQAGGSWPNPRFREQEHTVLDRITNRMWAKDASHTSGSVNWESGIDLVEEMNTQAAFGYTDWRLPNIRELESIVDIGCHTPALSSRHPFIGVREGYWSSTTSMYDPRYAWVIYMVDGAVGVGFKSLSDFSVWPVRDANSSG